MDEDEYRCHRIDYGPVCDAYTDEEVSTGWEVYMGDAIVYPFEAKIINSSSSSKIPVGETVTVSYVEDIDVAGTVIWLKNSSYAIEEVEVQWNDKEFYVAVDDLGPVDKDIPTLEVIKDWNYWLEKY